MQNSDPKFAERIKQARKAAGYTQSDIAKALGLTPQAISNYERGTNRIPTWIFHRMCVFYKVTPDWLLGIDDDMEQTKSIDSLMEKLLRSLGYGVVISRLSGRVVFQEEGECDALISLDEYKQYESTVFSYIKYQTSDLVKTARERLENEIAARIEQQNQLK